MKILCLPEAADVDVWGVLGLIIPQDLIRPADSLSRAEHAPKEPVLEEPTQLSFAVFAIGSYVFAKSTHDGSGSNIDDADVVGSLNQSCKALIICYLERTIMNQISG